MAKMIWLFYFSKIMEFVDTMIMVVKKNNRQISFLHVYHHCSIFTIWWLVTFVAPNGEGKPSDRVPTVLLCFVDIHHSEH